MVQVGTLFPVYFHIDEMGIHDAGRLLLFETLPFHHVAPMTGSIADAHQEGFILYTGFLQGLFPPGIPIHGIMRVL